jgi:hypothetical protein
MINLQLRGLFDRHENTDGMAARGPGQEQGRGWGRGGNTGQGRGKGRGGGNRPTSGPGGNCVCPKCGHKEPHVAGQRCLDRACPECGTKMVRE